MCDGAPHHPHSLWLRLNGDCSVQGEGHLNVSPSGGVCVQHGLCTSSVACLPVLVDGGSGNPADSVAVSTRTSSADHARPHLVSTDTHASAAIADSHMTTATHKYS